jgi:hypothetical protein
MVLAKAAFGAILLFIGREVNFLFAGGFAALIGFRLAPALPAAWPPWSDTAFIVGLGVIAAAIPLIHERAGYAASGILAGGYFMVEYFAPGLPTLPPIPFIVGAFFGAVIMGLLTEWALMLVSSVIGAVYLTAIFNVSLDVRAWLTGALFLVGALTQVILRRMTQK